MADLVESAALRGPVLSGLYRAGRRDAGARAHWRDVVRGALGAALATPGTTGPVPRAAAALGVGERTLRRWLATSDVGRGLALPTRGTYARKTPEK